MASRVGAGSESAADANGAVQTIHIKGLAGSLKSAVQDVAHVRERVASGGAKELLVRGGGGMEERVREGMTIIPSSFLTQKTKN